MNSDGGDENRSMQPFVFSSIYLCLGQIEIFSDSEMNEHDENWEGP